MQQLFYPPAIQRPLANHSGPGILAQKNTIVLHCTDGPTAEGAIATFETSKAPHRVSAHFVIGRDGTDYQLLPISDVAWHASQCNTHSVGIEHAGSAALPCTAEQYIASAALVAWLCQQMGISCDRLRIRTHQEASPADGHIGCCTVALDPDKVVAMAQDALLKVGTPT